MDNKGLVSFASRALAEKWGYVWGTFGQLLTVDLLTQKCRQYPAEVGSKVDFIKTHWLNRMVVDCVGLIKAYYWTQNGSLNYNPATDVSADGMFERASEKGVIGTLPEIPGICLWKRGHIGVYIGGGKVIEARGTMYGVIESTVSGPGSAGWTNWLKCPYINYVIDTPVQPPHQTQGLVASFQEAANAAGYTDKDGHKLVVDNDRGPLTDSLINKILIRKGSESPLVKWVQNRIISLGFSCGPSGADGEFGPATLDAVEDFQRSRHLVVDGVVGPKTINELLK